jgi:hypothetical protein
MNDRGEQLRIKANHPRQDLRVGAIVFPIALVNLAHFSGISDDDLVSADCGDAAHPPGMRSRFKGDPRRRLCAEVLLQRCAGCAETSLAHQGSFAV